MATVADLRAAIAAVPWNNISREITGAMIRDILVMLADLQGQVFTDDLIIDANGASGGGGGSPGTPAPSDILFNPDPGLA